jgi:hypothetical protein
VCVQISLFFFSFLWYWSLNSGSSPWAILPALFLWKAFRDRYPAPSSYKDNDITGLWPILIKNDLFLISLDLQMLYFQIKLYSQVLGKCEFCGDMFNPESHPIIVTNSQNDSEVYLEENSPVYSQLN